MHRALVIAQVAVTLVVLFASSLLVRSLAEVLSVKLGFRTDHLLTMHMELTGSPVAERIITNTKWHNNVTKFAKIFPKDYKRVLEAQRDALERGEDVDEAVMAAARG